MTYALGVASSLAVLAVVIELLRRQRMRERHAAWWLALGFGALVIAVFPRVLDKAAEFVGVAVPSNLAFFVALVTIFLVALQTAAEMTKLEERNRVLVEKVAMIELRVHDLESSREVNS